VPRSTSSFQDLSQLAVFWRDWGKALCVMIEGGSGGIGRHFACIFVQA
jgi:hypothetical protein